MYDLTILNANPQYEIIIQEVAGTDSEILLVPLTQLLRGEKGDKGDKGDVGAPGPVGPSGLDAEVAIDFVALYNQAKV